MSALAVEDEAWNPSPVIRTLGFWDRACRICGWRFFTSAALRQHEAKNRCHPPSPAQAAAWRETGRQIAQLNNSRRRTCDACGYETTPGGLGLHQKATGHQGWTDART